MLQGPEKRGAVRYTTKELPVRLRSDNTECSGTIIDVSRTGAFISGGALPKNARCDILINRNDSGGLFWSGIVSRIQEGTPGYCAVQFKEPLSEGEIVSLIFGERQNGDEASRLAVVKQDYAEVSQEIRFIQSCRSTIFVGIMASLATAALAIWKFYVDGGSRPTSWLGIFQNWSNISYNWQGIFAATTIVFFLFIIGVLSTIEKARAINLRKGFVAVLDRYIGGEKLIGGYRGWAVLKHCLEGCRVRQNSDTCNRKNRSLGYKRCKNEGEAAAAGFNSAKRISPNLLESFTSLTSYLYTVLYGLILLIWAYSAAKTFNISVVKCFGQDKLPWWAENYMLTSLTTFGIGVLLFLDVQNRTRKNERKKALISISHMGCGCVVAIIILEMTASITFMAPAYVYTTFALEGMLGAFIGGIGWYLLQQLCHLRIGKYSFETYFYTWQLVISTCDPLPENGFSVKADGGDKDPGTLEAGSWRRKLRRWTRKKMFKLMDIEEPATVREEFKQNTTAVNFSPF